MAVFVTALQFVNDFWQAGHSNQSSRSLLRSRSIRFVLKDDGENVELGEDGGNRGQQGSRRPKWMPTTRPVNARHNAIPQVLWMFSQPPPYQPDLQDADTGGVRNEMVAMSQKRCKQQKSKGKQLKSDGDNNGDQSQGKEGKEGREILRSKIMMIFL